MLHVINGHHKPAHKNNHAAHEYGVPYRIPSFHPPQTPKTGANGSTESLPTMDTFGRVPDTPISYFDGISGQRRMSKSEQASPSLLPFVATPTSDGRATTSQPSSASLEFPYLSGLKNDDISSYWNINTNLSSQDSDVGLLSATSLGPGMWTFGGNELPLNNRNRSESEPLTWANGDTSALAQPALTHSSSSRPQSELEDPFGFDDPQLLASAESRHSALNVDLESWTSRNLTDNLRQEPINNRWSMPSFPGEDSSSFDISTFQFPGQHKDNLVGQTRGSAMENIRPASVVQHSSVSYDNITSQPRSASTLDLSSTTKPQLPSGNGNDETLDWLNTLSWDYDIPAAEAFDNRTMDGLPLFPDDNGSNIALSNNVTGEELLGDMLVPSSGTPNKAVYDNPTGNVSYIGATPRTNPNPSDWLH
ncbi:MAG: hypothetical protein M1820_001403 [Bogoriella megaspora]|nr:MAG: hypothetical protein M1820_001403 [Bogoriella megaspora]